MVRHRFEGVEVRPGDLGVVEAFERHGKIECGEFAGEFVVQYRAIGHPQRVGPESVVVDQVRSLQDQPAQGRPFAFVLHGDHHLLAVGSGDRPVGRDGGMGRPHRDR